MTTDSRKLIEELGAQALKGQQGYFSIELKPLSLISVFSKPITASAQIELLSEHAFCFHSPPAMKALGPLWVEGLERKSQIISAIQDAIYRLQRRLKMRVKSLETWGLKSVHIAEPDALVLGSYEFPEKCLTYRMESDLELRLGWINDKEIDASGYSFSVTRGQERTIVEQMARAHYQKYFEKEAPAVVPVLPAFGTGSRPLYDRVAELEETLSTLKAQIQKAETELQSLKATVAYMPVPVVQGAPMETSTGKPRAVSIKSEEGNSLDSLAHLIAPLNEVVSDAESLQNLGKPEDFEAPPATVAMDLVPPVPMTDVGGGESEVDFEEIKDTVAMDLVPGAGSPFLDGLTEGESLAPVAKSNTQTEEDMALEKAPLSDESQDEMGEQLEALLAESSEPELGAFGKSFTGEHVFDSEKRLHHIPDVEAEKSSGSFEQDKEPDAALMVEKGAGFESGPLTAAYELGTNESVAGQQEAQFVSQPPPWSLQSREADDGLSKDEFPAVALVINNPKALKKLNKNLGQHIKGLVPVTNCDELETHLSAGSMRSVVFVRPGKEIVSDIDTVKESYPEVEIIVVSNDMQTFGSIGSVDHLLPLVNQVSQVAKGILEILN